MSNAEEKSVHINLVLKTNIFIQGIYCFCWNKSTFFKHFFIFLLRSEKCTQYAPIIILKKFRLKYFCVLSGTFCTLYLFMPDFFLISERAINFYFLKLFFFSPYSLYIFLCSIPILRKTNFATYCNKIQHRATEHIEENDAKTLLVFQIS